jgi:hypothetical protein
MSSRQFRDIFKKHPSVVDKKVVPHIEFFKQHGEYCAAVTGMFSKHEVSRTNSYLNKVFKRTNRDHAVARINDEEFTEIMNSKVKEVLGDTNIPYDGKVWSFDCIDSLTNAHLITDRTIVDSDDLDGKNKWRDVKEDTLQLKIYWLVMSDFYKLRLNSGNEFNGEDNVCEKEIYMRPEEILIATPGVFIGNACGATSSFLVIMNSYWVPQQ